MDRVDYAALTVAHKSAIKRWSHRARFRRAIELLALGPGLTWVDYGCGDGHLLQMEGRGIGYEPVMTQPRPDYSDRNALLRDWRGLCDRVSCLEVLEHLHGHVLSTAVADIRALLRPDGRAVVSVPLEIGLSALGKGTTRWLVNAAHGGTTVSTVARSTLGLPVPRVDQNGYVESHVGFDHRALLAVFRDAGLVVTRRAYSPLPLGPLINSQVFFVLTPARHPGSG